MTRINLADSVEKRRLVKRQYDKIYYQENRLSKLAAAQTNYMVNKSNIRARNTSYVRDRRRSDVQFKLIHNIRRRINHYIRDRQLMTVDALGCSIADLKQYLESKFRLGMSWDNYGPKGWHIDHVQPLSSFDLADRAQFLEACHYTNLQPLWWHENLSKGARHAADI